MTRYPLAACWLTLLLGCSSDAQLPANEATADGGASLPVNSTKAAPPAADPESTTTEAAPSLKEIALQPFGGLAWDDTFLTALDKVRKIPGATKVAGRLMERQVPADQLQGDNLRTWLAALFAESDSYRTSFLEKHPLLEKSVFRPSATGVRIEAESLSVAGLAYRMRVHFSVEKGLVVVDPQQAEKQTVEFLGPTPRHHVPLVLNHVELMAAEVVSPEAQREIASQLLQKYGSLRKPGVRFPVDVDDPQRGHLVQVEFIDKEGNTLNLYPGGKLIYRNAQVQGQNSLEEQFKKRAAQHQEQQRKGRTKPGKDQLRNL